MSGETRIAGYYDGNLFEWSGEIYWVAYWSRALTSAEIRHLSEDLFAAFSPQFWYPRDATWGELNNLRAIPLAGVGR